MKKNTFLKLTLSLIFIILLGTVAYLKPLIAQYKNKYSKEASLIRVDSTKNKANISSSQDTPSNRFQDTVVLVTGGISGIGLATAVKFAAAGESHVIVCGRDKTKWEMAQNYIKTHLSEEQAKKIEYWPCDVRIEAQVKETN